MAEDATATTAVPKTRKPLSDLARQTRSENARRTNEKRRQQKAAAQAAQAPQAAPTPQPQSASPPAPAGEEDPVVALITSIVDQRLEAKLTEARTGSTASAMGLLAVQVLANSGLIPGLVKRLAGGGEKTPPAPAPAGGLQEYLAGV